MRNKPYPTSYQSNIMQKVYLLLRDNQPSGPYSLADLESVHLTEKDLVWDISKNSGWCYPFEMGLPFTLSPGAEEKKVAYNPIKTQTAGEQPEKLVKEEEEKPSVSSFDDTDLTIDQLSQKITQIRQKLMFVEEHMRDDLTPPPAPEPVKTELPKKEKKKRSRWKLLAAAAVLIVLVITSLGFLVYQNQNEQNSTAKKKPVITYVDPSTLEVPEADANAVGPETLDSVAAAAAVRANDSTRIAEEKLKAAGKPTATSKKKVNKKPVTVQKKKNTTVDSISDRMLTKEETEQDLPVRVNYVDVEAERRTFFQKILDLFRSKENTNATTGAKLAGDITDYLDVKVNTTNYKWLKGVQGLTLTMVNRSTKTIVNATVNVVYLNKDNNIMEKNSIRFRNIRPNKAQTIAAADHPFADHAGYEIVAITATK